MTQFRHDPLPCDTALERLEVLSFAWPPEEPLDTELQAAWQHAQECSACAARIEQRREADNRIAATMQAVSIPLGLKERLLAQASLSGTALAAGRPDNGTPAVSAISLKMNCIEPTSPALNVARQRRAWWLTAAAALLVVFSTGLSLWFGLQPRGISLQALYDQTPLVPIGLTEVRELAALPSLPANWTRQNGVRTANSYWFSPYTGATPVAWISFELQVSKTTKVRGVLLAALKSQVIAPPPEWIAAPPRVTYTKRGANPVAVASWSERGVVYVCFVPGDAAQLEHLLQRVAPIAT